MALQKIVSGGQTGVDRGALDVSDSDGRFGAARFSIDRTFLSTPGRCLDPVRVAENIMEDKGKLPRDLT
jgi:hypothetical protein